MLVNDYLFIAFAPQIDYFLHIFCPILKKFGVEFESQLIRRGYYPVGRGEVICLNLVYP